MKKHLLLLLGLIFTGVAQVNAQCTPDPNHTTELIYPTAADTTFAAIKDSAMEVVFTMNIPVDTVVDTLGFQLNGTIDSVIIDSVVNMPMGVSYVCSEPNCVFPGGGSYCIKLSGAPADTGVFMVQVALTVYVTAPQIGQQQLTYLETIPLTVSGPNGVQELSRSNLSIYPQPARDRIYFSAEDMVRKVYIYDVQGRAILETPVIGTSLDVSTLENGNYIMIVSTDNATYSQPIVILK